MQNRIQDRGLGIFTSLFGLGVFILSFTVKKRTVLTIGPGFMPRIIGGILLLLGLLLTLQTFRKKSESSEAPVQSRPRDFPVSPWSLRSPVLATFLLLILYVGLLEVLGFTLVTACYLTLQLFVLAETRTLKRFLMYVPLSVGASFVITVIFSRFLRLYLPQGIFR